MTRAVLRYYDIATPTPQRGWYRRLRQGDYSIFWEELERWGEQVTAPKLVTVALCRSDLGLGLAVTYLDGWLCFRETTVQWSPLDAVSALAFYCPSR